MTRDTEDKRIREDFEELRAHTERAGVVPEFDAMMARAKSDAVSTPDLDLIQGGAPASVRERVSRRRIVRVGGWMSLAAAAAAAGLLLVGPSSATTDAEFESLVLAFAMDAASGAWHSPTSSLLDTPGLDLASVPSVGELMPTGDAIRSAERSESEGRDS